MADFTVSSGNVFADLGFTAEQAEEMEVKSGLIGHIAAAIHSRGLTQTEAAALVGTDQPTLSKVLRGRMHSVSVERLTAWLNRLGYDVTVTVTAKPETAGRGHFSVDLGAG
ncbi:helix-turn-helix transcriptional regulator [Azospirillum sp. SYSU D00513]|uniref:helix-turn-helix domain-containing protein n=1 Tax=Azospirillum sp. SYSU D00513 TaxID=2812561 RepID=UPI001A97C004|nr:helix-turn-helix transcriptional regulator [Azospirillum sp. SYSU D00513]